MIQGWYCSWQREAAWSGASPSRWVPMETMLQESFPGNRPKLLRKPVPFCGQNWKPMLTGSHPLCPDLWTGKNELSPSPASQTHGEEEPAGQRRSEWVGFMKTRLKFYVAISCFLPQYWHTTVCLPERAETFCSWIKNHHHNLISVSVTWKKEIIGGQCQGLRPLLGTPLCSSHLQSALPRWLIEIQGCTLLLFSGFSAPTIVVWSHWWMS